MSLLQKALKYANKKSKESEDVVNSWIEEFQNIDVSSGYKYDIPKNIPIDIHNNIKNDVYGEYLLAKYEMIRCIVMNDEHNYFKNGISLMKDSANKGNVDAQEFLNQTKLMEIDDDCESS